jgi:hypothetical protein
MKLPLKSVTSFLATVGIVVGIKNNTIETASAAQTQEVTIKCAHE